jgi:hypothetical protein
VAGWLVWAYLKSLLNFSKSETPLNTAHYALEFCSVGSAFVCVYFAFKKKLKTFFPKKCFFTSKNN